MNGQVAIGNNLPVNWSLQLDNPMAEGEGTLPMGYDYQSDFVAGLRQLQNRIVHSVLRVVVQRRGGFVEQEDLRLFVKGTGYPHTLFLTT